jgi:hypothetical protein
MSVQSPAITAPVVTTASSRRGILAAFVNLLDRSTRAEAEQSPAERYWTSVARGL